MPAITRRASRSCRITAPTDQNARRMQVMIDGRSVYLTPGSTVEWSNLPITVDDIERIEVIRRSGSRVARRHSTRRA